MTPPVIERASRLVDSVSAHLSVDALEDIRDWLSEHEPYVALQVLADQLAESGYRFSVDEWLAFRDLYVEINESSEGYEKALAPLRTEDEMEGHG